jgi:hypothetical protein
MKTTEGSRRVRRLAALTRHADAPALPGSKGQATLELIEARFGCGARHDATRRCEHGHEWTCFWGSREVSANLA